VRGIREGVYLRERRVVTLRNRRGRLRARAHKAQGGLCFRCAVPMKEDAAEGDPLRLTADHLIPLHAGGETRPGNIVAACRKGNGSRHREPVRLGARA
jgi:5-methylcytosine-specific restriction endonuclease McrA